MRNRLGKALVCATMAGSAIGLFAAPSQAAPEAGGGYWSDHCDWGRACIQHIGGAWYNLDGCGFHGINDLYTRAQAHGNGFRVYYQDGRTDDAAAWTTRGLDPNNRVVNVEVWC
ncbi:hypothetical protein ACIBCN_00695 [Nocardia sp. NPDC051052]|uniref:hypothetical protein n=1 Tax=Nocardia sp. NPDC051052 TaxID=3364322 RepID=UPI003798FC54